MANVKEPLRFLSPALLPLKRLVIDLWLAKLEWAQLIHLCFSELLPPLLSDLPNVATMTVPRWLGVINGGDLQLHVYADASKHACSAAAYILVGNAEGAEASLLCAKVRLAPRETSIHRLEQLVVLNDARIATFLGKEIPVRFSSRILFTDSEFVMPWLCSMKIRLVFVENR